MSLPLMSYAVLKILLLSSYHYLIRVIFPFRIRNAKQVNALRQVCNGNFISALNGLHPLPKGVVYLHLCSFNAFNYNSILCWNGINLGRAFHVFAYCIRSSLAIFSPPGMRPMSSFVIMRIVIVRTR